MRRAPALVLLVAGLLAGCGQIPTTHHNPGNSHEVATAPPKMVNGEVQVPITIARGQVSPPSGWVELKKGQPVAIIVTSDVSDELHVHGYDVSADLLVGKPVTVRFTADMTGVFQVETHENKLVLTQLAVR